MITPEEEQKIINKVTEKLLLSLPEVIGNLITNHIALLDMNKDFYLQHPELRDKKDIVASVVEMIEGRDPTVDYKDILNQAVPEIKERIRQVEGLNLNTPTNPTRHLKDIVFNDNGEF